MRLVLIWFATWKNANASYVPLWVKSNLRRFPRVQSKDGVNRDSLSPLGEASMGADSEAFRALMRHIREVDPQHTVIMMQVENEAGLTGDSRDRSAMAEAVWNQPVPADLMNYLQKNKANLVSEVSQVWGRNGSKTFGTWPGVFGIDAYADEVFLAWHVGRYIGKVAEAGKTELAIPMYANAWLVQNEGQLPGGYPSGGPISRVMDIWRAAAPKIDLLEPDIYRLQRRLRELYAERQSALHSRSPRFPSEFVLGHRAARRARVLAVRHRESGRRSPVGQGLRSFGGHDPRAHEVPGRE